MDDDFLAPDLLDSNQKQTKASGGIFSVKHFLNKNFRHSPSGGLSTKQQPFWRAIFDLGLSFIGLSAVIFGFISLYRIDHSGVDKKMDNQLVGNDHQLGETTSDSTISAKLSTEDQQFHQDKKIYVDVAGAVVKPGLHQVDYGSRLAQAIKLAGGLTDQADQEYIAQQFNLALELKDGQKLYFPTKAERQYVSEVADFCAQQSQLSLMEPGTADGVGETLSKVENSELVSLNTASSSQLETLPQIGEKRAEDIVAGRPYQQLSDLITKEVLTETIFEKIKNEIKL